MPYWRDSDVQREADVIEEVARVHGLDRLPATLPARRGAIGGLTGHCGLRRRLEDALRDRGLSEAVSYSFIAPAALDRLRLGEDDPALAIANPLSTDQSVMRPLLLPGLLDAARHNAAHDRPDLALFESAHVYRPSAVPPPMSGDGPQESPRGMRPSDEHHHLGRAAGGHRRGRLALAAGAGRLLRPARRARVGAGRRRAWSGAPSPRCGPTCTPAARRRSWPPTARSAGWASCTRWWPATGSWATARRRPSSSTWTRWP